MKRKYTTIFASEFHEPITRFARLRKYKWEAPNLALFHRGKVVGDGKLILKDRKKKYVHTEQVGLLDKYRRKGHGIYLYVALIEAARTLGATRIYSSKHLNRFSGRMWAEKLKKLYDVIHVRRRCKCKCRGCIRQGFHYINLEKSK